MAYGLMAFWPMAFGRCGVRRSAQWRSGYSLGAMVAGQAEVDLLRMTVKAQKDVRAQKRELEAEVHTQ